MDSGLFLFPSETRNTNSRYDGSSSNTLSELPAATFPGDITFTRIPDDTYSSAMQRAKFSSAALADAKEGISVCGTRATYEDVKIKCPGIFRAIHWANTARARYVW